MGIQINGVLSNIDIRHVRKGNSCKEKGSKLRQHKKRGGGGGGNKFET